MYRPHNMSLNFNISFQPLSIYSHSSSKTTFSIWTVSQTIFINFSNTIERIPVRVDKKQFRNKVQLSATQNVSYERHTHVWHASIWPSLISSQSLCKLEVTEERNKCDQRCLPFAGLHVSKRKSVHVINVWYEKKASV